MKLNLLTPALILALILSILFGVNRCDRVNTLTDESFLDRSHARQVEDTQNRVISSLRDSVSIIRNQLAQSTAKYSDSLKRLKTRQTVYVTRTEVLRPEIQALADSVPVLKEFIASQDSTIAVQGEIIATQEGQFRAHVNSLEKIIMLNTAQIEAERQKTDAWRESSVSFEGKSRKQERRKKGWRTATIILVGVAGGLILAR